MLGVFSWPLLRVAGRVGYPPPPITSSPLASSSTLLGGIDPPESTSLRRQPCWLVLCRCFETRREKGKKKDTAPSNNICDESLAPLHPNYSALLPSTCFYATIIAETWSSPWKHTFSIRVFPGEIPSASCFSFSVPLAWKVSFPRAWNEDDSDTRQGTPAAKRHVGSSLTTNADGVLIWGITRLFDDDGRHLGKNGSWYFLKRKFYTSLCL